MLDARGIATPKKMREGMKIMIATTSAKRRVKEEGCVAGVGVTVWL
jgi:hypothetical protein